jgi:hypothetical protein
MFGAGCVPMIAVVFPAKARAAFTYMGEFDGYEGAIYRLVGFVRRVVGGSASREALVDVRLSIWWRSRNC